MIASYPIGMYQYKVYEVFMVLNIHTLRLNFLEQRLDIDESTPNKNSNISYLGGPHFLRLLLSKIQNDFKQFHGFSHPFKNTSYIHSQYINLCSLLKFSATNSNFPHFATVRKLLTPFFISVKSELRTIPGPKSCFNSSAWDPIVSQKP